MALILIKSFSWCNKYGLDSVTAHVGTEAVVILNSYKIKRRKHIKEVIKWIKSYEHCEGIKGTSNILLISEWQAHNLLYWLGYQKDRTNNCDLNFEIWYKRLGYFILSLLYFGQ